MLPESQSKRRPEKKNPLRNKRLSSFLTGHSVILKVYSSEDESQEWLQEVIS